MLANKSAQDAERIKQKIKTNPLMEASNFGYLDDLKKLAQGNVPNQSSSSSNSGENKNTTTNSSNQSSTNPQNNQQLLIFAGITLLIIFYFYTQNQEASNQYEYD